jgi:hypothetical protein
MRRAGQRLAPRLLRGLAAPGRSSVARSTLQAGVAAPAVRGAPAAAAGAWGGRGFAAGGGGGGGGSGEEVGGDAKTALGQEAWDTVTQISALASEMVEEGRPDEARALLREGARTRHSCLLPSPPAAAADC